MVFVAMFIHSIPEGVALGVGFATGHWMVGALMALVIAVHNVPEGLAIALPIRAEGGSLWRCIGLAVLSSLPQPIVAVPALLGFAYVQSLLPVGLGFAAGAMLYLSFVELVPEALKESDPQTAAWGLMTGLAMMLLMTMGLQALLG
ncbi:MAG: ZIP family metal transporter, partial [Myxococcota bacterium]